MKQRKMNAVIGIVFALSLVSSAFGQNPRFRVDDLKTIGFTPNPDSHGTLGINNKGQCVFAYTSGGVTHAWIFLPAGDYGYGAGVIDLSNETGSSDDNTAIAHDVNESGVVVGQVGAISTGSGNAAAWTLSGGATALDKFGTLGSSWSKAWAVNNESDEIIVGDSALSGICRCDDTDTGLIRRAFRLTYDSGASSTLIALSPGGSHNASLARGVGELASSTRRTVGASYCGLGTGCTAFITTCNEQKDPAIWANSTLSILSKLDADVASEERAINGNDESAGWALMGDSGSCSRRAAYRSAPGNNQTDLGAVMPSGQTDHASRAEGLNDNSLVQIVGWNETSNLALLWEEQGGGGFAVIELNDNPSVIPDCAATLWTINQAHEINDDEWIIAWGEKNSDDSKHALLLTPVQCCPADTNNDGCVNIDDWYAIQDQWSSSGSNPNSPKCWPGKICTGDTDLDCDVDIDDLTNLAVFFWCQYCEGCDGLSPEECECEQEGFGEQRQLPTLAQLIEFFAPTPDIVEAILNSDIPALLGEE